MRSVLWPIDRSKALPSAVYIEFVSLLFTVRLPIAIMGASFATVGALIGLRSGDVAIGVIAALGTAVSITRLLMHEAYWRQRAAASLDLAQAQRWERRYTVGGLITAALVGAFAARTLMLEDATANMLAVALVFGYGAGAVTRCSIRPALTLRLLYLAVLPAIAASLLHFDLPHVTLAVLTFVFMLGSFETVNHLYETALEQLTLKQQFADLARRDPLTGLPNRRMLHENVETALREGRRTQTLVAVHSIDLDHFKEANDLFGHPVGDALLQRVGLRLARLMRKGNMIARIGGDEFIVVQTRITHRREADILARRIAKALRAPFSIDDRQLRIGGTVGIAVAPHDGETFNDLLRKADKALYDAKRARGDANPAMRTHEHAFSPRTLTTTQPNDALAS